MQTDTIAVFIPIVAIIMGVGIGMLSLYLDYRKKRDIYELHHKERMAAIEKGMEVPPLPVEFFRDNGRGRNRTPEAQLRRGLVLLLVGIAISVALYAQDRSSYLWGLVPTAIGLAYLIAYAVGRKDPPADGTPPDAPRNQG